LQTAVAAEGFEMESGEGGRVGHQGGSDDYLGRCHFAFVLVKAMWAMYGIVYTE
jgi:hypothetical protein